MAVGTTPYPFGTDEYNVELTSSGNTLFGLWRAESLVAGTALPDGSTAIFGRDYAVGYGEGDSPDLIAGAYVSEEVVHQYLDPDAVEYGEVWRVYTREQFGNQSVQADQHEYFTRPVD